MSRQGSGYAGANGMNAMAFFAAQEQQIQQMDLSGQIEDDDSINSEEEEKIKEEEEKLQKELENNVEDIIDSTKTKIEEL